MKRERTHILLLKRTNFAVQVKLEVCVDSLSILFLPLY